MELNPIQANHVTAAPSSRPSAGSAAGFGELLTNALRQLQSVSAEANAKLQAMATGEDVELHDVMLALEMESLAISLATEVRNKVVEAYREISRMQI